MTFPRTQIRTADETRGLEDDRIFGRHATAFLSVMGTTTIAPRRPVDRYGIDMIVVGPLGRDGESWAA